jgi:pteridine reductase
MLDWRAGKESMKHAGKTALITGAGRRVGRKVAERLAAEGMMVAVHANASSGAAESLVAEILSRGGSAKSYTFDLSGSDGAEALARAVLADHARVDLLVNNASIWPKTPVGTMTADDFDRTLAVNLRSPFLLAVALGREMKRQGSGLIVNMLDWSLDRPYPDYVPYGIAKAGLWAATRGLARALAPEVRVNGVSPGTVLLPEGMDDARAEEIRRAIPLGRVGRPEDIADAIVYLLGADYATGTILTVDGGRSLR